MFGAISEYALGEAKALVHAPAALAILLGAALVVYWLAGRRSAAVITDLRRRLATQQIDLKRLNRDLERLTEAERRRKTRSDLLKFLARAEELQAMCREPGGHPPMHQAEDWLDEVKEYCQALSGPALVDRFMDDAQVRDLEPDPGLTEEQQRLLVWLERRCRSLRQLVEEFV